MASDNLPFPELVADATSAEVRLILGIPLELPLELRRKIWHIYLGPQLGRIIEIEWDSTHPVDKHHGYRATKISSQAPLDLRDPICRDTRNEILRKYQLWRFDNRPEGHDPPSRLTYFDSSIDTIYFGYRTCLVDEKVTFRPARYNGAHQQRRDLHNLRSINEIRLGQSQFQHWTVHSQPKFHFVRLSERAEPGKVYDDLELMRSRDTLSDWKRYKKDVMKLSSRHCRIRISSSHFPVLELYGTKEANFSVKKTILLKPGTIDEERNGNHFRAFTDDMWNDWNFRFGY
ncbi:uncharacterized protein EAF01_004720 [Botrytis porri]|uniref:uncharacterized protein n=1 Tax=Botrytis porri TaxID=87229 RepID=UPI0018FF6A13|nr:uncharacterized protein EAF01_004720 [Botrytis porri]KAF7907133.1 hypothetical protein EAF01_004720 [Botrytis porri]